MQKGVLFDLAGLDDRSAGELLGMLLAVAAVNDEHKWALWKERGDALLAQKDRLVSDAEMGMVQ